MVRLGLIGTGLKLIPDTFTQLADGKLNGQKAFMTGALKVKGNVMLAVSHCPYRHKYELKVTDEIRWCLKGMSENSSPGGTADDQSAKAKL
jgi:hypothetical protein